jgi:hypothetical protein
MARMRCVDSIVNSYETKTSRRLSTSFYGIINAT